MSFTDDQLLNLVNNTILKKTEFKLTEFTGGSVQATSTNSNKITSYKVSLFFGYKSKKPITRTIEITKDTYYIWGKAILLKVLSLQNDNTGMDISELNALMNNSPKVDSKEVVSNIVDSIVESPLPVEVPVEVPNPKKKFSFSLKNNTRYENLSSEYQEKLKGYAVVKDGAFQLQKFINHHGALGSKFKNWSMAYSKWLLNAPGFDSKYTPDTYRRELNDHPEYDAVFVEYGTRRVYNADYDFVTEFKVQQAAVNVKAEEPTEHRDAMSLIKGVAERKVV